jgi:hypothetical protein
MSKDKDPKEVQLFSESIASETQNLFLRPSRIIEYLPPGPMVVARDCVYGGEAYSKGAVCKQADGPYVCSGDGKGTWVPYDKAY